MFLKFNNKFNQSLSDSGSHQSLKIDMIEKMAALITAAFGLVAALAWNDLIKTIFTELFGEAVAIGAMIVYAIIVTIIAVILTITVARASARAKSIFHQEIFKCELCPYETKIESKFIEHQIKDHAASPDKFLMK